MDTPLDDCERRDPKGLYELARRGDVPHFTGVSDPYEAPRAADLTIDLTKASIAAAGAEVLRAFARRSTAMENHEQT